MSKLITDPTRALRLMGVLQNNVDIKEVPDGVVEWILQHPVDAGKQFTAFLKNGGRVMVGEPKVITIVRGRFNPTEFIGEGWSIVPDETDQHSMALTEVDLTKVQHLSMFKNGENIVKGEEKLKRLKQSGYIRLDVDIFYTLWTNQRLIPESWKEHINGNTRYIYFDGTVFRSSGGRRCVLCLYWRGGGWDLNLPWLEYDWSASCPSAVLAS